ncbi:MAG: hypothetical protein CMO55_08315 [Verrucomicrobiales bacterium]|nr:hypothetical protein [Verrucomicrobiales bacterium]
MKSTFSCFLFLTFSAAMSISQEVRPLAQEFVELYRSPDPKNQYAGSPGITRLEDGRLVASHDLFYSSRYKESHDKEDWKSTTRILISDDKGKSWKETGRVEMVHSRTFIAGDALYAIGKSRDVRISRSDDHGETWTKSVPITDDGIYHQSSCNVHYAKGNVYLVMEWHRPHSGIDGWQIGDLAPVMMRAKETDDLTKPESWTFASKLVFEDVWKPEETDFFGVPFFPVDRKQVTYLVPPKGRGVAPLGWLETNVVEFNDPNHLWHDPSGNTFHLWMRAHTGGTGYAAIAKVTENKDGSMTTSLQEAPSGKKMLFIPCPGGQLRFHVLYDEETSLYWLLSSQATDSMIRPDAMPKERWGLPNNERHRLQLHFSKNMVDWCFAGLVCTGNSPKEARHYAGMCFDGDDICVVSRSGDETAHSAHNTNLITFHRVKNFRNLVY